MTAPRRPVCKACRTRPLIDTGRAWVCAYCDMGAGRPDAGPPVLLAHLRKGHQ